MNDKQHILVVDDEPDAGQFMTSLLEDAGYTVSRCAGGREALQYVEEIRPDLVVSDVRMPEMDGLELASRIKRADPQTRIVLYSAFGDWPMLCEALGKGCDDLLPKPCRNEVILRTIERVLAQTSA